MFVTPEYVFKDVTHITPEWLAAKGIRALVLDIDNTLTADRSQDLPDEVAGWLAQMKAAGVGLTIVSSGAHEGSYAATTTSACLRNASSSLVKTGCCAMLTAKYLSYSRII